MAHKKETPNTVTKPTLFYSLSLPYSYSPQSPNHIGYQFVFLCYHMIIAPVKHTLAHMTLSLPHDCHSPKLLSYPLLLYSLYSHSMTHSSLLFSLHDILPTFLCGENHRFPDQATDLPGFTESGSPIETMSLKILLRCSPHLSKV